MSASIDVLENAAFTAWPCVQSVRVGGWLVRTAGGYTKRANSANWVAPDDLSPDMVIEQCTRVFDEAALRPIFRLVDRAETRAVEDALARQGWQQLDRSLVMTAPAAALQCREMRPDEWALLPLPAWAAEHARLAGQDAATAKRHLDVLSRIAQPAFPAVMRHDGEVVACGLAVADGRHLGFFDIFTSAAFRGRGLARRLMVGQLAAARRLGIETLYLQVVEANAPAIALYRKLGFGDGYRYRYRVR